MTKYIIPFLLIFFIVSSVKGQTTDLTPQLQRLIDSSAIIKQKSDSGKIITTSVMILIGDTQRAIWARAFEVKTLIKDGWEEEVQDEDFYRAHPNWLILAFKIIYHPAEYTDIHYLSSTGLPLGGNITVWVVKYDQ